MKNILWISAFALAAVAAAGCSGQKKPDQTKAAEVKTEAAQTVDLPPPYETKSVRNFCKVVGWPAGKMPVAPAGFKVSLYAGDLNNPRNIYVADNGDVFAAQATTEAKGLKKVGSVLVGQNQSQNMGESLTAL